MGSDAGAPPLRPCPSPEAVVCSRARPNTDTSLATAVSMASVTLAPDTAWEVVEVLKLKNKTKLHMYARDAGGVAEGVVGGVAGEVAGRVAERVAGGVAGE